MRSVFKTEGKRNEGACSLHFKNQWLLVSHVRALLRPKGTTVWPHRRAKSELAVLLAKGFALAGTLLEFPIGSSA